MADFRLEADEAATGERVELGRYAVWAEDDGSLIIARAAPMCETCAQCRCGEQAENIRVPGMVVRMAIRAAESGRVPGFMKGFSIG